MSHHLSSSTEGPGVHPGAGLQGAAVRGGHLPRLQDALVATVERQNYPSVLQDRPQRWGGGGAGRPPMRIPVGVQGRRNRLGAIMPAPMWCRLNSAIITAIVPSPVPTWCTRGHNVECNKIKFIHVFFVTFLCFSFFGRCKKVSHLMTGGANWLISYSGVFLCVCLNVDMCAA